MARGRGPGAARQLPGPESDEHGEDLSGLAEDIVAHPDRYANNVNENVRKDGSRLWMAWTNRALLDERGEIREVLVVGNDVTELVVATQAALREREEERIAQEERSRLARDLHDSVTQALFAATMKAEALMLATDSLPGENVQAVEDVRRLNRGALAQMRTLLFELRGDPLGEVPLRHLLRQLAEAAEARSSANVLLTIRGDEKLPPDLHVAVYRITQEALTNVTRHAKASKAWVDLDLKPGEVAVSSSATTVAASTPRQSERPISAHVDEGTSRTGGRRTRHRVDVGRGNNRDARLADDGHVRQTRRRFPADVGA